MKVTKYTFFKGLKKNLGNYNMLDVHYGIEIEPGEGEEIDQKKIWTEINQQLGIESTDIDPDWIRKSDK